jgi:hypothetical protein
MITIALSAIMRPNPLQVHYKTHTFSQKIKNQKSKIESGGGGLGGELCAETERTAPSSRASSRRYCAGYLAGERERERGEQQPFHFSHSAAVYTGCGTR